MVKFSILFYRPPENRLENFEAVYVNLLALMEQIPDIKRRQMVDVVGTPEKFTRHYRILELYFDDRATMNAALNSEPGQAAGATLFEQMKAQDYLFHTYFADVYEDEGGSNPPPETDTDLTDETPNE